MELMATCLERLLKKLAGPVPEDIVCKMAVSVSTCVTALCSISTCVCVVQIVKALDYLKTQHQVIHRGSLKSGVEWLLRNPFWC